MNSNLFDFTLKREELERHLGFPALPYLLGRLLNTQKGPHWSPDNQYWWSATIICILFRSFQHTFETVLFQALYKSSWFLYFQKWIKMLQYSVWLICNLSAMSLPQKSLVVHEQWSLDEESDLHCTRHTGQFFSPYHFLKFVQLAVPLSRIFPRWLYLVASP